MNMAVLIEDFVPIVKYNGLNTAKDVSITGNLTVTGTTNIGSISLTDVTTTGNTVLGNAVTDTTAINGATTITSTSANALTVGRQGATSPQLKIDASATTVVTGFEIIGAASGAGLAVRAIGGGTNENLTIDAKGSGTVTINGTATGIVVLPAGTTIGGSTVSALGVITSSSATALAVGLNGATNSAFVVDSSTASQAAGLKITGAVAAGTVAAAVISSGADASLTVNAKGTGTIGIGSASTGLVVTSRGSRKVVVNNGTLTVAGATQNATASAAQLLGGFLSHQSQTGAGTLTLDTGTNISSAVAGAAVGDSFRFVYANIGNQTVTITGDTGSTVVGTAAVPTLKNATITFYCTGSNAWTAYCVVSA